MATLAYSYVRMSTERQIKGDSLRRQLEWSAAFAERNDLVLDNSLRDIGVSAWKGKNRKKGALGEFLRMVEDGLIPRGSYLLVESLDRLSRSQVMEALELFNSILRQGITIATMDPEQVYTLESVNREFGQLIIALTMMSRANEESERKSSRVRQAFAAKREMAANGIGTTSKPPSWITATKHARNNYTYELNERAPLIREIFEMAADGMGAYSIAIALNRRGEPAARHGSEGWWSTTIARILSSRAAIGEHQPLTLVDDKPVAAGDPIPNYYPAVVGMELWQRAQKTTLRRNSAGRRGEQLNNLLGDLCRCAHCGNRMYFKGSGGEDGMFPFTFYLTCRAGRRAGTCRYGNKAFRYRHVEDNIFNNIVQFGFADILRARQGHDMLAVAEERVAQARDRLEQLQAQSANLMQVLAARPDSLLLVEQLDRLEAQTVEARTELTVADRALAGETVRSRDTDTTNLLLALREQWEATTDMAERFKLRSRAQVALRQFVQQIDFDGRDNVYRVILGDAANPNVRAFEFENLKRWSRVHKPAMRVVDVMPLMEQDAAYGDAEHYRKQGYQPLDVPLANAPKLSKRTQRKKP